MKRAEKWQTCYDCEHCKKSRDYFFCKKSNYHHNLQDRFFTCIFFEQKEVNPENAKRTDKTTKPEKLEIRRKSTAKEPNANARRNKTLTIPEWKGLNLKK